LWEGGTNARSAFVPGKGFVSTDTVRSAERYLICRRGSRRFGETRLDAILFQPLGDACDAREAGEMLKKKLALGPSRDDPDPMAAIAEAERQAARNFSHSGENQIRP
jgi:hypothetical protein